jgi:SAM-dependent methyltransferase
MSTVPDEHGPGVRPAGERRAVPFSAYAAWYDAFNHNKDYDAEVEYLLRKVADYRDPPRRWLDIGCGTGHHLASLHARGVECEGVELSPSMVERARMMYPHIPVHLGSAQEFAAAGNQDVVSMLFHVINYQTTDVMVRRALARASAHLAPSGLLVLDFWNTEAVLRDPPVFRVREAQVDGRSLVRLSIPRENRTEHRIDVVYQFRWDSPEGAVAHEEVHAMRHFSGGELEAFLRDAGMTVLCCEAWMQDRPLSSDDWYGFICARLRKAEPDERYSAVKASNDGISS